MTVILDRAGTLNGAKDLTGEIAWHRVCPLEELEPAWGEAALIAGRQVALFRTGPSVATGHSKVFAVAQQDPATLANVMARGIIGSRGSRPTIASPLHKEVYDLETGECFSNAELSLEVFATRLVDGFVEVGFQQSA
ncbi:nitrite reductase small subunit NirD [Paenarthrobacter sp. NPDC057355]|uniref:nitrite reductase small subunit NirD n=1 Tax=Paenarthrobacter sp. NPDC057355 TaxID=3346105 RepID=UPI00362716F3